MDTRKLERVLHARRLREDLANAAVRGATRDRSEAKARYAGAERTLGEAAMQRDRHRLFMNGEVLSVAELEARRSGYDHLRHREETCREELDAKRRQMAAAEQACREAYLRYRTERLRRERLDDLYTRFRDEQWSATAAREEEEAVENHQSMTFSRAG